MTELRDVSIDDVRTLVAERQRYDDWLAALEAKRAETPARVFERVHGDYSARREGVMDKLREHVGTLASLGDELEGRVADLEAQLSTHEDERAEAMLRTAVGEYDSERWEAVRLEVEASIAMLTEQRGALLTEVDDVRTLLASARSEPPERVAPAEPVAATALTPPAELGADEHAEPIGGHALEAPAASESDTAVIDSPAVTAEWVATESPVTMPQAAASPTQSAELQSVDEPLDTPAEELFAESASASALLAPGAADAQSEAAAFVAATQDDLDASDFDDALALFSPTPAPEQGRPTPLHGRTLDMLDRLDTTEPTPAPPAPPVPAGSTSEFGRPAAARVPDAPSDSSRDPFDDLAFLRSVIDPATQGNAARPSAGGDQQKTLRCTECGTMNLPTEWYCERCGGELAAF